MRDSFSTLNLSKNCLDNGVHLTFFVGELIREGRLQAVLTDYKTPETAVYAIYPERKYLSPKVRAFIEFFAQRFGPEPYWDRFEKANSVMRQT